MLQYRATEKKRNPNATATHVWDRQTNKNFLVLMLLFIFSSSFILFSLPSCFQSFCHFSANYSHLSFFSILILNLHYLYFFSLLIYTFFRFVTPCLIYSLIVSSQCCIYLTLICRLYICYYILKEDGVRHDTATLYSEILNSCKWNSIHVCPWQNCNRFFNI